MKYKMIKIGASSLIGAVGGNRLSRYQTDNIKDNIKKVSGNDMMSTAIGTLAPMAMQYFAKTAAKSAVLASGVTAFILSLSISYLLHNRDIHKVDKATPEKPQDIADTKKMVQEIFETILYPIYSDVDKKNRNYHPTTYDAPLPMGKETKEEESKELQKLIHRNLYPFLGVNPDQMETAKNIAKTQKSALETLHQSTKDAYDSIQDNSFDPDDCMYYVSNVDAFSKAFTKKAEIVEQSLIALEKIQAEPEYDHYLLQRGIKELAKFLASNIESKYKKTLIIMGTKPAIAHCSKYDFYCGSTEMKNLEYDLRSLSLDELNGFLQFCYGHVHWQNEEIKPVKDRFNPERGDVEVTEENQEKVRQQIPFMSYQALYDEKDLLKKCKNIFLQAQREKLLPDDSSPFDEARNRYQPNENAFPGFEENEKKPFLLSDAIIRDFGSKEKAIEVCNDMIKIEDGDTEATFDQRKNRKHKMIYARQYHTDKNENVTGAAMAYLNGLKSVEFELAQKYWTLPEDQRQ